MCPAAEARSQRGQPPQKMPYGYARRDAVAAAAADDQEDEGSQGLQALAVAAFKAHAIPLQVPPPPPPGLPSFHFVGACS